MNILIFSPHPDDDIIGCGGSIAKHTENKDNVTIVYMTSGDSGSMKQGKKELVAIREKEARNSMKILGVTDLIFLRNPDGYLECNEESLVTCTTIIREKKPDVVYMPHKDDNHKDHKAAYEIAIEAVGRAGAGCFQECSGEIWTAKTVLCYEVWTPLQEYAYVNDISRHIDKKILALREHASQIQGCRYDEAIRGLNRYRGIMSGIGDYCECFSVKRIHFL